MPATTGDISLQDLRLQPAEFVFPRLIFGLRMVYQDGLVTGPDWRTGATVWSGPLTASFTAQAAGGVCTLSDGAGRDLLHGAARPGDQTQRLRLVGVPGSVTVADTHGRTLGRLPICLIAYHLSEPFPGWERPHPIPFLYRDANGGFGCSG